MLSTRCAWMRWICRGIEPGLWRTGGASAPKEGCRTSAASAPKVGGPTPGRLPYVEEGDPRWTRLSRRFSGRDLRRFTLSAPREHRFSIAEHRGPTPDPAPNPGASILAAPSTSSIHRPIHRARRSSKRPSGPRPPCPDPGSNLILHPGIRVPDSAINLSDPRPPCPDPDPDLASTRDTLSTVRIRPHPTPGHRVPTPITPFLASEHPGGANSRGFFDPRSTFAGTGTGFSTPRARRVRPPMSLAPLPCRMGCGSAAPGPAAARRPRRGQGPELP
jgi:hypothetical protein